MRRTITLRTFIADNRADIDACIDAVTYRYDGRGGRGTIPNPPHGHQRTDVCVLQDEALMTRQTKVMFAAFIGTQILDGVLTFAGVSLGLAGEANPLIAWIAAHVGLASALFLTKCAAGTFGAVLALNGRDLMLAFLTLFYWGLAIAPWLLILGFVRF